MANRVEAKVIAAVVGSGAGATIGEFVTWVLGVTVWHADSGSGHTEEALAAVPGPVASLVVLGVAAVGTALAGWWAPHTPRSVIAEPPPLTDAQAVDLAEAMRRPSPGSTVPLYQRSAVPPVNEGPTKETP